MIGEALAREHWTDEQWEPWLAQRWRGVLAASERASWYPERAGSAGVHELASWPVLTKDQLRRHGEEMVIHPRPRFMHADHSSGTTGTPVTIWSSHRTLVAWYALAEARWRQWHGVDRRDRWGILGGQLVAPPDARRPPYWVWNAPMHQLYLSSYHLSARTAADYGRAIDRARLTYILGYPSALHELARSLRAVGYQPRGLRVVITNAEPLFDHQRQLIGEVFGCPVRDTYGMAEMAAAASECGAGRLHLWPEVGIVEVLDDDDRPLPAGTTGRLVCTSLINPDMPLIRYDTGDMGSLAPEGTACGCGRTLPVLQSVEGRRDDLVVTADGRLVGRLDPVFKADLPLRRAQIRQEAVGRFRVLVEPDAGYDDAVAASIAARLRDRVGPAEVEVEVVDEIPRSASGKFRAVVSHVDPSVVAS